MQKKISSNASVIPKHKTSEYILSRMASLGWKENRILAEKSNISAAELSRIKNGDRASLSPLTFYKLVKAFGDTIEEARILVYPELDLALNDYTPKKRNRFGHYMNTFEEIKNTIDIIAFKTGIPLSRMKELYYKTGAPEAYEILLIEKAVGKKPGEIFKEFYETNDL